MSKKKKPVTIKQPAPEPEISEPAVSFFSLPKAHYGIVALIAFLFYANSIGNDYALDDAISITANKYTQKGFAGISDIFSKDTFTGYAGEGAELSGGRWRPLALITFAIEQQFTGGSAHVSHFFNVLLYVLLGIFLLKFLREFIFPGKGGLALFATLLFVIHPIHTEVVANIKSRDEILSLLFLVLTLQHSLKWLIDNNKITLIKSLLFYFLALLSKENGLTFLAILPLTFYFFGNLDLKESLKKTIPLSCILVLYILLRLGFIGFHHLPATDINIAPYLYATESERFATIVWVLGKYLLLLFFPHPLSADYSFNQIPYKTFGDLYVILSIVVHLALILIALKGWKKKSIFSYAILFYLGSIFIVSNILVDTGGILGERFLFQPSFGFVLGIAGLAAMATAKMNELTRDRILAATIILLMLPAGYKTIERNAQWKDTFTLFIHDVEVCPNSVRTNIGAGNALVAMYTSNPDTALRNSKLREAIRLEEKALSISPNSVDPYLMMGAAYFNMGNVDMAEKMWDITMQKNSNYNMDEYITQLSNQLLYKGLEYGRDKNYDKAISYMKRALNHAPDNVEIWYNLGGAYFTMGKLDSAKVMWDKTLLLKPDYKEAQEGMKALMQQISANKK